MKPTKNKTSRVSTWYGTLSIMAVLLVIITLASCNKEPYSDFSEISDNKLEVRIALPQNTLSQSTSRGTRSEISDEDRLDNITVFIFKKENGSLEQVFQENLTHSGIEQSQPKWKDEHMLLFSMESIDKTTPKNIYAVANWSETGFNIESCTEQELKDAFTVITEISNTNGDNAYPILMSGSTQNVNLTTLAYQVKVDIKRQVAKIKTTFTLSEEVRKSHPNIEWLTDQMKITVVNVPDQSYVIERNVAPSTAKSLNSKAIPVDDTKPGADDSNFRWEENVYVNENPVTTKADKEKSTYIVMQLPYKNSITQIEEPDNYYKIYIDDKKNEEAPHTVLRNTIYNLEVKILGLGLPINNLVANTAVEDKLTVTDWEDGMISEGNDLPKRYFNIDRTKCVFDILEEPRVNLSTNVVDWELVADWETENINDFTVFSYAKKITKEVTLNGIVYSIKGDASSARITIKKDKDANTLPSGPTFYFKARNLIIPLIVNYDNGLILVKDIPAGWTTNRPKKGLQIAKRGNVLPSGVASSERLDWYGPSRDDSFAQSGYGFGFSNSQTMRNNLSRGYMMIKQCIALGDGWYIPSLNELELIQGIYMKNTEYQYIGKSYTYINNVQYYSSTQRNDYTARAVYMNKGGGDFVDKNGEGLPGSGKGYYVRCVRNID